MVVGCVTEECALALSADRMWKVTFAVERIILPKVCVGFINAVEVEGDGGPGCITTMKLNPAVGDAKVMRSRLVARDGEARLIKMDVLEGGKVCSQPKSQVMEVKLEAAGDGACVAKLRLDYEKLDGEALSPEDQTKLAQGYLGLLEKVEAYLIAHPAESA